MLALAGCEKLLGLAPVSNPDGRDAPPDAEVCTAMKGVATGGFHTCAINASGDVYCWGANAIATAGYGADACQRR